MLEFSICSVGTDKEDKITLDRLQKGIFCGLESKGSTVFVSLVSMVVRGICGGDWAKVDSELQCKSTRVYIQLL